MLEVFTAMTKRRLLAGVMFGLMVLLMAVACGGTESRSGSGSESGAIAEAKAEEIVFDELKEEASQFGLYLLSSDEDEYRQIRDRLFANEELASALRAADDEGVYIILDREFRVRTGYVVINVEAIDQEIIEFLLGK